MIISRTDFVDRPYKIPNRNESGDLFPILEREEERLAIEYLLGPELWDLVNAAAQVSGGASSPYDTLINGADYVYNTKTYRYYGWVDTIRPALYAHWIPLTTVKITNVGPVVNNAQQASKNVDDYYPEVVNAWNESVLKVGYLPGCLYNYRYKGTFYGFMNANKADYPEWIFRGLSPKNRYDI